MNGADDASFSKNLISLPVNHGSLHCPVFCHLISFFNSASLTLWAKANVIIITLKINLFSP
jgi:hypothetical protein